MEAEKHVMRAQLRDLMEKQQAEVQRMAAQHQAQMDQAQQDLMVQLEELRRASTAAAPPAGQDVPGSGNALADPASAQKIAELEGRFPLGDSRRAGQRLNEGEMSAWMKMKGIDARFFCSSSEAENR